MAIRSSGYLHPSKESGAFGPGVYLTDLEPSDFYRDEILANNYGGIMSDFHNRADWVVEISEESIDIQLLRKVHVPGPNDRRIFVYPFFILVRPDQIYDKPRCFKSNIVAGDDTSSDDSEDDTSIDCIVDDISIDCSEGNDASTDDSEDEHSENGAEGNFPDSSEENEENFSEGDSFDTSEGKSCELSSFNDVYEYGGDYYEGLGYEGSSTDDYYYG